MTQCVLWSSSKTWLERRIVTGRLPICIWSEISFYLAPEMNGVFFVVTAGRLCCVTQWKQVACHRVIQCVSFIVSLSKVAIRGCPSGCRLYCARKMLCSSVPPCERGGAEGAGEAGRRSGRRVGSRRNLCVGARTSCRRTWYSGTQLNSLYKDLWPSCT